MQQVVINKNMRSSTKPNSLDFDELIGSIIKMALTPPKNQNKDESDFYRWKSSFNFRKNINTMYYTNLSDSYQLQDYLRDGYNQVKKMVEFFQNTATENMKITQESIMEQQKHYGLMKKYKNLLTHQYFQKETSKQHQNLYNLPFEQAKKIILKEYPDQFNRNQVTKYFQDLIVNHKLFSFKAEEQEFVFQEIVKRISPRISYNVYLPTMVKVIMANVNWIDRENDTASLALKIEVKVNVPGISQYPYFYEQVFKEKMKISFKTSNRSNVFNQKVKFDKKNNERQTFQIVDDKVFKKKTKSKYHHDPIHFLNKSYKWLNYDKPTYIYQKRVQQFEGFILQASVSDVRVLINAKTFVSPFEMLDLHGIVQLDSIITQMKDWIQILYEKDNSSSLKQFLIQASPKVTIKFNLISLYQNLYNVQIDQKITLNHIRSFDTVESDGYHLAQNLMFLEITNKRQSKYSLKKFSKCKLSYKWYRNEEKIFERKKLKNQYIRQIEVQQEQNNLKDLYQQLKIRSDHRYFHNKYSMQFSNYKNIKQMNKKLSEKFYQIRSWIYQHSKPIKPQPLFILQQNKQKQDDNEQPMKYELYHEPENLKYNEIKPYLSVLKCIEQAYIHNQLYINNELNQIYHNDFSEKLSRQIYKFAKYKYKFQKYYKRVLEILIVQLEDQKGIYFDNEQQQSLIDNQNLRILKQRLKEVIYNHNSNNLGQNLENVKTDQEYHYSKAIYHFPFYRNPLPTLLLLFSSTIILCVINLFIFFQQQELNGRLASTAALMICFIGMVAIMQKQIHSDSLSIFEILIYGMMLTPVFCLAFSLQSYLNQKQITTAYVRQSPLFWLSVLFSLLGFLVPVGFAVFFIFCQTSIYQKNYNVEKQMQPLFLLFPGSPQVDRLIAKQQNFLEYCDDQFTKDGQKKYKKNKTLQRVVTSLMVKHLNSLYQLRKTDNYIKNVQSYIKWNLKKSIKNNQKFIQNTFQIPKYEKGKETEESLQSTANISLQNISPTKQKKNKNENNFEELREIFKSKKNLKCVVFSWDD